MDENGVPAVVELVTHAVAGCDTPVRACAAAASVLSGHTGGPVQVMLSRGNQLSLVAASGSWSLPTTLPRDYGIVGAVIASGQAMWTTDVAAESGWLHLGADGAAVFCVPITGRHETPIGVINIECHRVLADLHHWGAALRLVGEVLGVRVVALGGPPAESRTEQMLRLTLAMSDSGTPAELARRLCVSAAEISGLSLSALLPYPGVKLSTRSAIIAGWSVPAAEPLLAYLRGLTQRELAAIVEEACRYGASRTLGTPESSGAGLRPLVDAGVCTLVAVPVPVSPKTDTPAAATLLVIDEANVEVDRNMVAILELLVAHAVSILEHLDLAQRLRLLAATDPLTGLRHTGPFNDRLTDMIAGRTAVLVIDVDDFKRVNDTLGHPAGDELLIRLAQVLRRAVRADDDVFRLGGDEFAAIVEVSDLAEAKAVGARVTAAAADSGIAVSVGAALHRKGERPEETVKRADMAMYDAKSKNTASH